MKKHLSVLALAARGTIYKVLLLLLAMIAVETATFYFAMQSVLRWEIPTLEAALTQSRIHWIAAAALLGLTALLSLNTCSFSAKTGYTLQRLSVSEQSATLWQALWHMICYVLFWAVQVVLALSFGLWYVHTAPAELISDQTMFLAFHRVKFLFSLLPMALGIRWARNILFCVSLGFTTACFSFRQRQGKLPMAAIVQTGVVLFYFSASLTASSADSISIFLTVGVLFAAAINFFIKEGSRNEKADS